ncbi:hypothetical protein [Microcoleus sp. herbarium12]|jgi:hypothetical protein|uniref:hypothetical protein n=1 Tax=Microcoleus sp. herbarium12 TaxID=3055437 RepID=UPI002FCFC05C
MFVEYENVLTVFVVYVTFLIRSMVAPAFGRLTTEVGSADVPSALALAIEDESPAPRPNFHIYPRPWDEDFRNVYQT